MSRIRRDTRIAAAIFLAIPATMLGAAVSATWALAHGAPQWLRWPFRAICHGLARRSFAIWQTPMPLCARCVAIYVGMFAGLAVFLALPWLSERLLRIILYLAATPLAVDGITQALRLRESTNMLRSATGLAAGLAFGMWVLSVVERRDVQGFTTS
jgi:uncharacterized membrane protein